MLAVIFRSEIATQFQESSKMFQIKTKTGRKQKRNEKEPGETNFLGLLWESLFRDNALVLRGTSSWYLRIIRFS